MDTMDKTKQHSIERFILIAFGIVFVSALMVVSIKYPRPTDFQYKIFSNVLALAAAGVATGIPGFIKVTISKYVKAGGAIAVFVIVYFFSPAKLVTQSYDQNWGAQDVQFNATNEGSVYRVKVSGQGHANVSSEKIDVHIREVKISYPTIYKDITLESIVALRVGLFCIIDTKYKEMRVSNRYLIDRTLPAGESMSLQNIDLSIDRPEESVKLSQCGLGLLVDIGGGSSTSTGYVGASSAPYTFK